ncbi:MAG: rhodanese-like domain-containing protein [Candidatus Saccharibacteria bacterium]
MQYTIIDVREPHEFTTAHVAGAINIPLGTISHETTVLRSVAKDEPIIVYCRSGGRSGMAMGILQGQGFTDVTNGINQAEVEAKYGL